ncbi:glycoside hydrolase family 13 protein [Terrabacter terrigena]|uniref:Glycoside hydrolase family 13 protein n=1 Tax=Terrabacter terrigena TaxID=574718 RepID=A0ABW3MSM5_9MICO
MTQPSTPATGADWWRQAVVYQIYPRSFADHNGDGIGDLAGVRSRIPYLADLGVDAVWLSPFYPSALADGGYDVDDYRDVDPAIGTLDEFDRLSDVVHEHGLRLIIDIVPNHTSNRHAWFRAALASGPGSPERARYHFVDGEGPHGSRPPSDWQASFGGPAWSQVADGQWYLHLFTPQQPDLNWDNPEVRQEFLTTLGFWADRGVDGFRIDVAHMLAKDLSRPLPSHLEVTADIPMDGSHRFYDRDEVHQIYASWRKLFDTHDPPRMAVAEAWVPAQRRRRYASPEGLGQAFNFDLLQAPWEAGTFRRVIEQNLAEARATASPQTWVLSNHDVVRHATRYGLPDGTDLASWLMSDGADPREDVAAGLRRARAATLLTLALPGSAYVYQGEELGLREVAALPRDRLQDPTWERTGHQAKGRDGCRVPIPWTADGPSFEFGPGPAHLPQPEWFADHAVAAQQGDPSSTLSLYRAALRVRRRLLAAEPGDDLSWVDVDGHDGLHFNRGSWSVVTNFATAPLAPPPGEVVLSSAPLLDDGRLGPDTTAWVVSERT